MALKFNPLVFAGFDLSGSSTIGLPANGGAGEVVVWKAAGEGEWALISNANVSATAAIVESKLSIPEMVKLTGVQTITGEKKFETPQPAEVGGLNGTLSVKPIVVKSGQGGNTSTVTTGTGGASAALNLETGSGGEAKSAKTTSTGGSSGAITFTIGEPGKGGITGGEKGVGGNAGQFSFSGHEGGGATLETTVSNKGGTGSPWTGKGGPGGKGENSLGTNTGGASGEVTLASQPGGAGKGGLKAVGGNAAKVKIETGAGGTATGASETNTNGSGAPLQIILGTGGGSTEALSGPLEVRYKEAAGAIRFYIHPEGNVGIGNTSTPGAKLEVLGTGIYTGLLSAKAGLTVEGATKLEGTTELKETLKVTGASTLAGLSATSGEFSTTLKVTGLTSTEGGLTVTGATKHEGTTTCKETLKVTGLTSAEGGLTVTGAFKSEGAATCKETLKVTGLTTTSGGLTVEGTLTLPAGSIKTAAIEKENVTKEKLAKEAQEELLTVAAFPGLSAYTSAKEETEAKPTFITMLVTTKAEAVVPKIKFANDGKEVSYSWPQTTAVAQKFQLTFLVKKGGKWKATLEGSAEKMEIARQVINSV